MEFHDSIILQSQRHWERHFDLETVKTVSTNPEEQSRRSANRIALYDQIKKLRIHATADLERASADGQ